MATKLATISGFLNYLAPHAGADKGTAQWGYVMGSYGQTLTAKLLEQMAKASYPSTWRDYVRRGTRWIGRRVFDCNGLAEGYYLDTIGVNINSRSRTNFSDWCAGHNGTDMAKLPQQPGTAVFHYSSSLGYIHHVGYMWKKYGPGPLDWYVIEASGVDKGVIVSDLKKGSWNRWGQMRKYYTYDLPVVVTPPPLPPPASTGTGTVTASALNVRKGPGTTYAVIATLHKGDTVKLTGKASGTWLEIIQGTGTAWVSAEYIGKPAAQATGTVTATALNVRTGPATSYKVLRTLHKGDKVTLTGKNSGGWVEIVNAATSTGTAWVSANYIKR